MNLRSRLQKLEEAAGREPVAQVGRPITAEEQATAHAWLAERLGMTVEEMHAAVAADRAARPWKWGLDGDEHLSGEGRSV
jgi:hypothetical protein